MSAMIDPRWLTPVFLFIVQLILFMRWLHRRIRNDEITRVFVEDIALNHLPHIYELLRRLCRNQGIDGDKPPIVRWLNMNDSQN